MPEPNERYPLQPDYIGPDSGIFFFCHHDRLFDWVWSARERKQFVLRHKPQREWAMRAAHFCLLTATDVPEIPIEVWAENNRLRGEGERLWDEGERLLQPCQSMIESAARRLISDCRWNGKTLLF